MKLLNEPRFHEGRNWTEEGNAIIFTRLIIRFHLPTSIERQAGRQARTHARTRVFLSSCVLAPSIQGPFHTTAYELIQPIVWISN